MAHKKPTEVPVFVNGRPRNIVWRCKYTGFKAGKRVIFRFAEEGQVNVRWRLGVIKEVFDGKPYIKLLGFHHNNMYLYDGRGNRYLKEPDGTVVPYKITI